MNLATKVSSGKVAVHRKMQYERLTVRRMLLLAFSRGLAVFIGGFSLLNIAGEVRFPGFDANHWWIDFRPIEPLAARVFLAGASAFLVAYSIRPWMSKWRRVLTLTLTYFLLAVCVWNVAEFYILLYRGTIKAGFVLPFSLFVSAAFAIVLAGAIKRRDKPTNRKELIASMLILMVCLVVFPLGQMFCFGKTNYRRPADAVVVFGARVYADGRVSDALADRVRTGCQLYLDGLVKRVIFSGGPGDGAVHETEAMQKVAMKLGVPETAIVLDKNGVNTKATVKNTCKMFERLGIGRVLVVSHFYHLPRIKMTYQRQRRDVYTVPAKVSYVLTEMPKYILREVAALWVYYLRPIVP